MCNICRVLFAISALVHFARGFVTGAFAFLCAMSRILLLFLVFLFLFSVRSAFVLCIAHVQ